MALRAGDWDEVVDVVVVGSGGGALTAALAAADGGADVLVIEKDTVIGGTTGVSGGVLWVPNNAHLVRAGLDDSRQDAVDYLSRIADGREADPTLIEIFVDTAREALEYLESATPLQTQIVTTLPDYYGPIAHRVPGCKLYSRSVEPLPFAAREALGEQADRLATRSTLLSLGAVTTLHEDLSGSPVPMDELARREREGVRVKGAALIACLMKGLVDRGVEIRTSVPAVELIVDDDRSVVGVLVGAGAERVRLGARQGVILGCGGFEWNHDMVVSYLGFDVKPISPGANTGDGHVMAMEVGAKMGSMTSFWGQGAMFDPAILGPEGEPAPQMMMGLGAGSVLVNQLGRRFMHGGYTYNDFPKPFGAFDQRYPGLPNKPPGWVIFGPGVKKSRDILTMRAGEPAPEWVPQAESIAQLAVAIGVDPAALEETVTSYNRFVEAGEDPEWGDPTGSYVFVGYDTTLAPVDGPPYYALQQWPATLGTNGGCRINANAQVLGHRVSIIPGLYAVGNTSASVVGGAYVGGGTPIASSVTFGYLAGRHASGQPRRVIGS